MILFEIKDYTLKQVLLASAVGRGLSRTKIENDLEISQAYITKCKKDVRFLELVTMFKLLPFDDETRNYKGLATLNMDMCKLIYNMAEKELSDK